MRRITEAQHQTVIAVACLTLLHGRHPTLRELGDTLGITHNAAIQRLHWLEKKGLWCPTDRRLTQTGLRAALAPVSPHAFHRGRAAFRARATPR